MTGAKNILRKHKEPLHRIDIAMESDVSTFFGRIATRNGIRTGQLLKLIVTHIHARQDSAFFKKMMEEILDD